MPQRNRRLWVEKFRQNRARDTAAVARLGQLDIRVLIVWECELGDVARVKKTLERFFQSLGKRDS